MNKKAVSHTFYSDSRRYIIKLYYQKKYNQIAMMIFLVAFSGTFYVKNIYDENFNPVTINTDVSRRSEVKTLVFNSIHRGRQKEEYAPQLFAGSSYKYNAEVVMQRLENLGYPCRITKDSKFKRVYLKPNYTRKEDAYRALENFRSSFNSNFIKKDQIFIKTFS